MEIPTEKSHGKTGAEIAVILSQARESWKLPEAGGNQESLYLLWKKYGPAYTLILDSSLRNCERRQLCCCDLGQQP